jgi:hypothetical protein
MPHFTQRTLCEKLQHKGVANMSDEKQISPIRVFREFERFIIETDVFPLSKANLIIQQDAYGRLGSFDENGEGSGEPFATLELGKKESDKDLRFMVTFTDLGVLFDIEGWGQMGYEYAEAGKTVRAAARSLFAAISALSNGQVFVLHTVRHGRLCAVEMVYREKTGAKPVLLALQGDYPKFLKHSNPDEYELHTLKNNGHTPHVSLEEINLIRAKKADGKPLVMPRVYEKGLLEPLTKEAYAEIIGQVGNDLMGVQDDRELEQKLFQMPEYWLIGAVLSVAVYFLLLRQFNLPVFLAGFVGFIASGYFTGRVMIYKEELRLTERTTWLTYASELAAKIFRLPYVYAASMFGVIVSTSFPIYVLKGSGKLVQLHELAEATSSWVSVIFFLLVGAFALALQKHWLAKVMSAVLGLAGVAGLFAANGLSDTSGKVATPEPQTTMAIALYLITAGLAVALLVKMLRDRFQKDSPKN